MKKTFSLFLFALIYNSATANNTADFNVMDFGTVADSSIVSTAKIQSAIDKCYQAGGGRVYFPPGEYKSGGLILKSNVRFHLESGATLIASRDTNDYKKSQNNSGDIIPVLLYAENAKNISIEGLGTINGAATHFKGELDMVDTFIGDITENARKAGVSMTRFFHYKPYTCMIYFENCSFVTVRDITLTASQFWTLHARWTDYLTIHGVKIFSDLEKGVNADGIDIDGCRNVTISDCIVETADDAIVLKTTALHGESRSCENVVVSNCVLQSSSTAIKLGTESHADFRYISFNNCIIRNSNRGLSIVIRDGAIAENIQFSNIMIEGSRRHFNWWGNADPIWLVVLKRTPDSKIGQIRNVTFNNIIAHGMGTSKLEGFDGKPLENIQLNNVQLFMYPENYIDKRADDAFRAVNVKDLRLTDVSVNWYADKVEPLWHNAFTFKNVENLNLDKLTGTQAPTNSGVFIELNSVKNALIQNCIPSAATTIFVKVNDGNNTGITLDRNFIFEKTKKMEFAKGVKKNSSK